MADYLGQNVDVILGQEFLTWLWFISEIKGGQFATVDQKDSFIVYVERSIAVQGGEGETLETTTVTGATSDLMEARLGVSTGKKVTKALIRIEHNTEAWQFALKAEDFSISSLKTPKVEKDQEDEEIDGAFLEKIYLIETCLKYLDQLYAQFLINRLNADSWAISCEMIKMWLDAVNTPDILQEVTAKIQHMLAAQEKIKQAVQDESA
jgi:hypothetical protein